MKDRKIVASEWFSNKSPIELFRLGICLTSASACLPIYIASAGTLTLADKGASAYRIIVSTNAIPSERYAAEELQRYLQKITNAKFPIVTDAESVQSREILLGEVRIRGSKKVQDLADRFLGKIGEPWTGE